MRVRAHNSPCPRKSARLEWRSSRQGDRAMATSTPMMTATHEVFNQPPPLADYNLFTSDRALMAAVHREAASWSELALTQLGAKLGARETIEAGFAANANPPVLRA